MISVICTIIVCVTVLISIVLVKQTLIDIYTPTQQPTITEAELSKAYEEVAKDKIPDFQDVINYINKEFTGVEDDDEI